MIKHKWLLLIPILLLSAILAMNHMADDTIWFDEWITYFITDTGEITQRNLSATPCGGDGFVMQVPFVNMLCMAAIDNSWPPAFFFLLVIWDAVVSFGSLVSDRFLALGIGLLSISITYHLGRRMFDHQTGLIAALLLGTNAFFIHYMHEVRGYTLYVFFPALSAFFYWGLLGSYFRARRGLRWGFVLSIAGTLYVHYIGSAVVLGIAVYHVLFARPENNTGRYRKQWIGILKLWLNGCLLYAPWISVFFISFINESLTQRSLDTSTLLRNTVYSFSNNLQWIIIPLILLTFLRWRTPQIRFLRTVVMTVGIVAILGNIYADFLFHPRHLMGALPMVILLIAAGIQQVMEVRREIGWLVVGVWVGAGIVYSSTPDFMTQLPRQISTIPYEAMNHIVTTVDQCAIEDDLVVLGIDTPNDEWIHSLPTRYYLPDHRNVTFLGLLVTDENENDSHLLPEELYDLNYATRVQRMSEDADHVWVFSLPDLPIQRELLLLDDLLQAEGFTPCDPLFDGDDLLGVPYSRDGLSCSGEVLCSSE